MERIYKINDFGITALTTYLRHLGSYYHGHLQLVLPAGDVSTALYRKAIVLPLLKTRRPASADRTARRQFQATGQLVSRTQASE